MAVVIDGPSELISYRHNKLARELNELTRDTSSQINFPKTPTHVGNHTLASARAQLRAALKNPKTRVIIGFGYFVGVAAAQIKPYPRKPILLPYGAPALQRLPRDGAASGRRNLTYLTGFLDVKRDLKAFREVIRDDPVSFLVDARIHTAMQKIAEPSALPSGANMRLVPTPPTAKDALKALGPKTRAVYLPINFRMGFAETEKLIQGLNERKIPSYAGMGPEWVEKGAFVTLVHPDRVTERFRRVALRLRDILAGEPLESMTTAFPQHAELFINMATARKIGVYPSFNLMTEARLLEPEKKEAQLHLSLSEAINEACQNNPAYRATMEELKAATAELRESRGQLLPRLDTSGSFTWLDPDATTSFGNAERTLSWGIQAQQILYSPLAIQAYLAQRHSVSSVEKNRVRARLDLILEVIQSFLQVLRARAVESLNRTNLKSIRTNRALAELRVEIGTSGVQDIARWDISLAGGRVDTISASARRNQAEIDLNRIMNTELERSFVPILPTSEAETLLIDPALMPFVRDIYSFKIFRGFMAKEALDNAPELAELNAQIKAQERLISGYTQQLYIPTLGAFGDITHILSRSGANSSSAVIEGFPPRDDFTWQFGANLSFTLFDDSRYGTLSRLRRTRSQLQLQWQNVANTIEQRVRSALHQAGASIAAVGLRRDAVKAARINLQAVSSAYREGTDTIITLVDAQNQTLQAEINAANALYTFLDDYAQAERASGRFVMFLESEERQSFISRLQAYAKEMTTNDGNTL
ncbi:MAG: TolC family protein [Myxococcales bacterium]|nr:TolC family protein [Myxococcales bacterium]